MLNAQLRARLYDAGGCLVDTLEGAAATVVGQCADFIRLHGTDPDENGAAAAAGRVEFEPMGGGDGLEADPAAYDAKAAAMKPGGRAEIYPVGRMVDLAPIEGQDGRWMGEMQFDIPVVDARRFRVGVECERVYFRVEAYAADSNDPTVLGLVDEFHGLAESGGLLQTVTIDGRECFLVVMPKGA